MNRQAGSPPVVWHWVALSLVVLFVIGIRVRLLDIPLERDEGEFAYVGQLMLDGIVPYKMAYVIKLPGTAAIYALSMVLFGQTTAGIHLGLLLANVTGIVLVFLVAKKWFGAGVGLIAAVIYALMSLSAGVLGSAAHATQFVTPAALGGILLLLRSLESGRLATLFWSGILFGLAFILKQPGILFGAFGGLLLLGNELKARPVNWKLCLGKAAVFCFGMILPFAILCLIFWRAGVFGRFWHWSFMVAGGGWVSLREGWDYLAAYADWLLYIGQLPFWVLAGLALPFVYWMSAAGPRRLAFLAFCGFSIFAGCLGLHFIPHYFVLTLPAVGMLIGLGVVEARQFLLSPKFLAFISFFVEARQFSGNAKFLAFVSFLPGTLFCVVCGYAVCAEQSYFFRDTPDEISNAIYHGNPFRAAVKVADYIKKNSTPDSRIAVLGSEPEIYFYAHRHSATGHLSTYILMEGRPYSHDMQEEMIREIKAAAPEYIIHFNTGLSWFMGLQAVDGTLLNAMTQYERDHYALVGVLVDDLLGNEPIFYWDAEAVNHGSNKQPYISVYKIQKPDVVNQLKKGTDN
jgi:hypothetical protein